jgi:hypothetical protein
MTQEEQRTAIAEACGWRGQRFDHIKQRMTYDAPDYLNDLNAMHEAKKTLNLHQQTDYVRNLMIQHKDFPMTNAFFATARQQAEAFLHAIGKWKEAKP